MQGPKYQHQIEPQLSKIHLDKEIDIVTAQRATKLFLVTGAPQSGKTHICQLIASRSGAIVVDGVHPGGGTLFRKVVRAIRGRVEHRDGLTPYVFIDDFGDLRELADVRAFFLPRMRVIIASANRQLRLQRSREAGKFQAESDTLAQTRIRHLQDSLRTTPKLLHRVSTDKGVASCLPELLSFCGL